MCVFTRLIAKMNLAAKFKWGGWYTADCSTLQQSSYWRWPRDGEFCTTRQGHINSSGKATISCSKENSKLESKGKTTGWWWEPPKTSTTLWVQYLQRAVHDGSVQIRKPKIAKGLQHTRWWKWPLDNNWFWISYTWNVSEPSSSGILEERQASWHMQSLGPIVGSWYLCTKLTGLLQQSFSEANAPHSLPPTGLFMFILQLEKSIWV